ncbi:MAG: hypothetical protein R3B54_16510 [Bdellovibrionota bacterium]
MRILVLVGLLVSAVSFGELPPMYPKRLEAVLIKGITDKTPLHIVTGELQNCDKSDLSDLHIYKCDVAQSYALVSHTSSQPIHIQFDRVLVMYSKHGEDQFRKYTFVGQWSDESLRIPVKSKVIIAVYNYNDNASDYKGFLELDDYGTREAIQAAEVPAN